MKVSLFKDYKSISNPPIEVEVSRIFDRVKNGHHKELIEKIRKEKDKKTRSELKKELPCVVFTGYLGRGIEKTSTAGNNYISYREDNSLTSHSGLCVVDLDDLGAKNLKSSKDTIIKSFPSVVSIFVSPSGTGLKVIFRIPADIKKHRGHYLAIVQDMEKIGFECDTTSINEARLSFESYDPDIYVNLDAEVYDDFILIEEIVPIEIPHPSRGTVLTNFDKMNIAAHMIDKAPDGYKHHTLVRAAYLLGGYISSGVVDENDAVAMLRKRISARNIQDKDSAFKTIDDGIAKGKLKPIYEIEQIEEEFKTYISKEEFKDEQRGYNFLSDNDKIDKDLEKYIIDGESQGLPTNYEQLDRHFRFKENSFNVILGHDNVGKALSLNTPLVTPNGWTTMGKIKVGDTLYDERGFPTTVTHSFDVLNGKKVYEIYFSNSEVIKSCEDHLWKVTTLDGTEKVITTKYMVENGFLNKRNQSKYRIKLPDPISFPKKELPINPYLLGVWLGDGTSKSSHITAHIVDFYKYKEIFESLGFTITYNSYKDDIIRFKVSKNDVPLVTLLKSSLLFDNKHIPTIYLRGSIEQRLELLQGLMDTDGCCNKGGRLEFCTKLPQLKEGFCELLSSLGIKWSHSIKKGYHYISFVCGKDYLEVFKLPRKLDKMRLQNNRMRTVTIRNIVEIESEPVRCISVDSPNNLFLCGKTMIPTHNSTAVWFLAIIASCLHDWKWIIYSPENKTYRIKKIMIDFVLGQKSEQVSKTKFLKAKEFVDEHFYFIRKDKEHTIFDLLNYGAVLCKDDPKIKGFMIDPYNSLIMDYQGKGKGLSGYEYHLKAATNIRIFSEKYCSVYLNAHSVTGSRRNMLDADGVLKRPRKDDIEQGGLWANRCDDFIVIHRKVKSEDEWMFTEFHVDKVKDVETGGSVTYEDAVKLKLMYFSDFVDEHGFSALEDFRKDFFGVGKQSTIPLGNPNEAF